MAWKILIYSNMERMQHSVTRTDAKRRQKAKDKLKRQSSDYWSMRKEREMHPILQPAHWETIHTVWVLN